MRKYPVLLLVAFLLFTGCSFSGERIKEPVNFYYLRNDYQYHTEDGVIAWEEREASGHRDNLSYLLALYRMGPSNDELLLPFPEGTAIVMMEEQDNKLHLALGDSANTMSDAELSLACACLTLTCAELSDIEQVTVTSGQRSVTMTPESITLLDSSMIEKTEETK